MFTHLEWILSCLKEFVKGLHLTEASFRAFISTWTRLLRKAKGWAELRKVLPLADSFLINDEPGSFKWESQKIIVRFEAYFAKTI